MGWTTTMKACKHEVRCGYCEENHCYRGTTCEHYKEWDCDKIKEENNMNRCIHEFICGYSAVAPCYHGSYCKSYDDSGIEIEKKENNMNKKELKMGDIVEIHETQITRDRLDMYSHFTSWVESVFVKYGEDDSIIVVDERSRNNFLGGEAFTTKKYSKPLWRIPKQKTYRPFTWEEREQLRGKWITRKVERDNPNPEYCITIINNVGIYIGATVTFKELYEDFIFLDGSPVGKLEETK